MDIFVTVMNKHAQEHFKPCPILQMMDRKEAIGTCANYILNSDHTHCVVFMKGNTFEPVGNICEIITHETLHAVISESVGAEAGHKLDHVHGWDFNDSITFEVERK